MTHEETILRDNLKAMKAEFVTFLQEYKKMRDAQSRERQARIDPKMSETVYSSVYYQQYLAEKSADEMFRNLVKHFSV